MNKKKKLIMHVSNYRFLLEKKIILEFQMIVLNWERKGVVRNW